MELIYKFKDFFTIVGGFCVGWSIPMGDNNMNILPIPDYYVFLPIGLIFILLSYLSIEYHYKK